ncbi:hypothetical protein [Massilia sp. Leaf139]|uniref:hypothetical protein n=1 Tax=Massilia sp. Leaf139 TaxID=1736272 RepID=UPI0006F39F76|nr:hypothetical protein [Massilia sp. Leaf139]KQQ88884.1 hypothetical protein ASF77_09205 [Massilia sp. Leaf139]
MKPRHLLMGAALVGAAALLAFGDNSPEGEVAEAVVRTAPAADGKLAERARTPAVLPAPAQGRSESSASAAPQAAPHILRLLPRHALLAPGDAKEGADVFGSRDWTPPPAPPPAPAAPPPPPPPSAPPLPFTLLGKALENGAWEVYLARAGKTYVVKPKTVIDGTYRVEAIAPPILTLTYLPLNQIQQLNIGAFD